MRPMRHAASPQKIAFNASGRYVPHACRAPGTSKNGHTVSLRDILRHSKVDVGVVQRIGKDSAVPVQNRSE